MALSAAETMYNLALGYIGEYEITAGDTTSKQAKLCIRFYADSRKEALASHPWNEAKKKVIIHQDGTNQLFGYERRYEKPSDCLRVLTCDDSIGSDVSRKLAGIPAWEVIGDYIESDAGRNPPSWKSAEAYIVGEFLYSSSVTYEVLVAHTSDATGADTAAQIAVDVAAGNIISAGGDYKIVYVEYIWDETDISKWKPKLKQAVALNLASKIIVGLTNDTKGKVDLINEYESLVMPRARSVDAAEGKPRPIFNSSWLRARGYGSGGWFVR